MKKKYLLKNTFIALQKITKISVDGKISNGHISAKDYLTCEKIWDKFEMKNMGDYHDHYLKKDVLLLADVFEKFISVCLNVDPCHYLGGISCIAKRYAKANNKYTNDYDPKKTSAFISYLGMNNLYG